MLMHGGQHGDAQQAVAVAGQPVLDRGALREAAQAYGEIHHVDVRRSLCVTAGLVAAHVRHVRDEVAVRGHVRVLPQGEHRARGTVEQQRREFV